MRYGLVLALFAAGYIVTACSDASAPDNNAPHLRAIPDQSVAAGATEEVELLATDANGDALTFNILSNPGFLTVEDVVHGGDTTTATLVIAPVVAHAGSHTGRIQVFDPMESGHTQTFALEAIAPERGEWWGSADFGVLSFSVSHDRTEITRTHYLFQDWQCGITVNGGLTVEYPSGWPITAGEFTIENEYNGITLTISGSFTANDRASGIWEADVYGTLCSGTWQTAWDEPGQGYSPGLAVFMSPDFSYADGALGFNWRPNSQLTFEVDNGANGSVDYQRTGTTDGVGNLNFRDYGGVAPFSIAEGDSVRMYDEVTVVNYVVVYVTLDDVDLANDILSGSAREGTVLDVRVMDPGQTFPGGPEVTVTADASDHWSADFGGVFDIVSNSSGWIVTVTGAAHTQIDWHLPLGGG